MIVCPWKELHRYADLLPGLEEAVKLVDSLEDLTPATYPLSDGNKVLIQQGTTKSADGALAEAHREYLDIQYILEGQETVGWAPVETIHLEGEFDTAKDKGKYSGHFDFMTIRAGYCYVVFPEDGHMPGVHLDAPAEYKKAVVKLKV
ncbi:MAG: YhcH/YjgK/YiaL family protein [Oscillospiraceae bacterium]|nr:YhcH/YjgK/YiaL family protein [Oscillospiraceae bacterium]